MHRPPASPPAALFRTPVVSRRRAVLPWLLGAVAASAALLGLTPIVLVGGAAVLATALAVAGEGMLFLLLLVVVSGFGFGWAEGELASLGGAQINLGGLRWGLIVVGCGALLLRGMPQDVPRLLRPYGVLVAVLVLGMLWAPAPLEALRLVLQFLAPLLIGLVAWQYVQTMEDVTRLAGAYWIALGVGLVAMGLLMVGAPLLGLRVPEGADLFTHRGFAMWLLPCYALALAGWRVRGGGWLVVAAALFALGVATLARATVLAMLVVSLIAVFARPARLRPLPLLLLVVGGFGALQYEPLKARLFANPRVGFDTRLVAITQTGSGPQLSVAGFNLTGRGLVWYSLFQRAKQRPLAGHGTAASTDLLHRQFGGAIRQPHNEYLRLFHDNGLLGLAPFLAFAIVAVAAMRRCWRTASGTTARHLGLAALLALSAYLVVSGFDNGALYVTFFTQNIFLLLILALRSHQLDSTGAAGRET
jgi:O-antigen ligase